MGKKNLLKTALGIFIAGFIAKQSDAISVNGFVSNAPECSVKVVGNRGGPIKETYGKVIENHYSLPMNHWTFPPRKSDTVNIYQWNNDGQAHTIKILDNFENNNCLETCLGGFGANVKEIIAQEPVTIKTYYDENPAKRDITIAKNNPDRPACCINMAKLGDVVEGKPYTMIFTTPSGGYAEIHRTINRGLGDAMLAESSVVVHPTGTEEQKPAEEELWFSTINKGIFRTNYKGPFNVKDITGRELFNEYSRGIVDLRKQPAGVYFLELKGIDRTKKVINTK